MPTHGCRMCYGYLNNALPSIQDNWFIACLPMWFNQVIIRWSSGFKDSTKSTQNLIHLKVNGELQFNREIWLTVNAQVIDNITDNLSSAFMKKLTQILKANSPYWFYWMSTIILFPFTYVLGIWEIDFLKESFYSLSLRKNLSVKTRAILL